MKSHKGNKVQPRTTQLRLFLAAICFLFVMGCAKKPMGGGGGLPMGSKPKQNNNANNDNRDNHRFDDFAQGFQPPLDGAGGVDPFQGGPTLGDFNPEGPQDSPFQRPPEDERQEVPSPQNPDSVLDAQPVLDDPNGGFFEMPKFDVDSSFAASPIRGQQPRTQPTVEAKPPESKPQASEEVDLTRPEAGRQIKHSGKKKRIKKSKRRTRKRGLRRTTASKKQRISRRSR